MSKIIAINVAIKSNIEPKILRRGLSNVITSRKNGTRRSDMIFIIGIKTLIRGGKTSTASNAQSAIISAETSIKGHIASSNGGNSGANSAKAVARTLNSSMNPLNSGDSKTSVQRWLSILSLGW